MKRYILTSHVYMSKVFLKMCLFPVNVKDVERCLPKGFKSRNKQILTLDWKEVFFIWERGFFHLGKLNKKLERREETNIKKIFF